MTDTKPTLEDLMDYVDCELNLADIEAQEIYTSLKELAAIKSQPVPTENDIETASYNFTEAEGFRHGARWAIDQICDTQKRIDAELLREVGK